LGAMPSSGSSSAGESGCDPSSSGESADAPQPGGGQDAAVAAEFWSSIDGAVDLTAPLAPPAKRQRVRHVAEVAAVAGTAPVPAVARPKPAIRTRRAHAPLSPKLCMWCGRTVV
jgi:hypothetical protein